MVTCEFENVPARALEIAGKKAPVHPPAKAFAVAQDRLVEKDFMRGLGIPVADYADVHDERSARAIALRARSAAGDPEDAALRL